MVKQLLCVLALVVATGCLPPPPIPAVTDTSAGSPFQADTLTADGLDRYALTGDHALAVTAAPASNAGSNTRVAVTTAWQPPTVNQAVCATWEAAPGYSQPGLMLRWDGTHGVSVTRNTWGAAFWTVNVHEWDLTRPDGARFAMVAQFPLTGLGWPGVPVPLPWRACAWATGPTVRFKVWPLSVPEPSDSDPCCSAATVVSVQGAGRAGWYVGHVPPGAALVMTQLVTY